MSETGHAFTYLLLLEESVANDIISVSLFAYDKITLKLKKKTRYWKKCLAIKRYRAIRLVKEFPNKNWSKRGVEDFLERLRTTGSTERAPGSGYPRTTCTAENVDAVGDLVQSQENQPQTHRTTRQISRELGIPQTNNWRWLFLFSFAMNVNDRIIAFLTEKCCYLNYEVRCAHN